MEGGLRVQDISKAFGGMTVLKGFSVEFPPGQITCILGPSGCGKTTLLRIIAGLVKPDSGTLVGLDALRLSFVFQEDRLLPWKSAEDNVRLVLRHLMDKEAVEATVNENLDLVHMHAYRSLYPHQMSGGMRQRIAFARAFSFPSDLILLDEPFKGLDVPLKRQLMGNVRSLLSRDPRTVVYVTHEPDEAAFFGRKILFMGDKPAKILDIFDGQDIPDKASSSDELVQRIKSRLQSLRQAQ